MRNEKRALSNEQLHRACVYADPDFLKDIQMLDEVLVKKLGTYRSIGSNSSWRMDSNGRKTLWVCFDIEMEDKSYKQLPEDLLDEVFKIAKEYCIEPEDIADFISYWKISPALPRAITGGNKRVSVKMDTLGVLVRIESPLASQQDIIDVWNDVEQMKRNYYEGYSKGKVKPTEQADLVYAIFKARKKNYSYNKIAQLYNEDKLDGVSNKGKRTTVTYEQLSKLYSRYRPDR